MTINSKILRGLRSFLRSLFQKNPYWSLYTQPSWFFGILKKKFFLEARLERTSMNGRLPVYTIFSCDLELDPPWNTGSWNRRTRRGLQEGVPVITNLLKRYSIPATFFTEGILGKLEPELIVSLKNEGHEIGLHGYAHGSYGGPYIGLCPGPKPRVLSAKEKRDLLVRGRNQLQEIINGPISSFRAPFLHIDRETIAILNQMRFSTDSSLPNTLFGRLSKPYHPSANNLSLEANPLDSNQYKFLEIPMTVNPIPRLVPHRPFRHLYPKNVQQATQTFRLLSLLSRNENIPVVIVFLSHPWEFIEIDIPWNLPVGRKRVDLLSQFFDYLSSLVDLHFVTMSQMARIWEEQYCPVHAKDETKKLF